MDIGAISGQGASATANSSLSKLGQDYQSFLKLLTAQISNQNPLEPVDSTTFVTQLAQLSQVEQAVSTNTNLETIAAQMANLSSLSGLNLIGRTVVAPSSQIALGAEGTTALYRVGEGANAVTVSIMNEAGDIVRVIKEAPNEVGTLNEVHWDGRDVDGTLLPEGNYSFTVEALNAEGGKVATQAYTRASVDRMSFEDGMTTLHLGNGDTVMAGLIETIE
ncbi:MAG: flagellar hook assembly protein FlgD [Pseudooceanicola sp.]